MKEITDMMKTLVTNQNQQMANHVAQLNHIHNRLVMMERNHVSHAPKIFQQNPNQMYQKKVSTQEPRIPNQLDSANMVEDVIPFVGLVLSFIKKLLVTYQIKLWNGDSLKLVVRIHCQASLSS